MELLHVSNPSSYIPITFCFSKSYLSWEIWRRWIAYPRAPVVHQIEKSKRFESRRRQLAIWINCGAVQCSHSFVKRILRFLHRKGGPIWLISSTFQSEVWTFFSAWNLPSSSSLDNFSTSDPADQPMHRLLLIALSVIFLRAQASIIPENKQHCWERFDRNLRFLVSLLP